MYKNMCGYRYYIECDDEVLCSDWKCREGAYILWLLIVDTVIPRV